MDNLLIYMCMHKSHCSNFTQVIVPISPQWKHGPRGKHVAAGTQMFKEIQSSFFPLEVNKDCRNLGYSSCNVKLQ